MSVTRVLPAVVPEGRRHRTWRHHTPAGPASLCAGLLVVVGVLVLLPLGYLLYGAVWSEPPRTPGGVFTLANLRQIYASKAFLAPVATTLAIGLLVGSLSVVIGAALAWTVTRTDIPRPGVWEGLLLLPIYFSPLMLALAFVALAAPRVGYLNLLWQALGGAGSIVDVYSFAGVVFVLVAHYAPYAFLLLVGPLRAIGAEIEEAALVLGSRRRQIAVRILLPMLRPAIFASALMIFTMAAENFAVPTLLGRQGKLRTIPSEIYFWLAYEPTRPNLAAAAGTLLLLITVGGIVVYRQMTRLAGRYVTVGGKPKPAARVALGRWRPAVTAMLAVYLLVTAGLPVAALVFGSFMRFIGRRFDLGLLTLQNYRVVLQDSGLAAIRNSAVLALLAATLATALGLLVSYCVRRTRAPARGALDYLSTLPIAIPGMVLGVGMLWAYVSLPLGLWGSIWILLIAYVSRFIVHAVRATSNSLLQISGEMDEAAQVLGAGLLRRLRDIVMPLSKRAVLASWVLLLIFALNEVTATILLYSSVSTTLSVLTWHSLDMQGAMQAFAYSSLQGLMTVGLVYVAYRIAGRIA